jgi:protein farnesyltransferase subunit beta
MPFEGGFQGRTNKLVDSCYSFWVGSLVALCSAHAPHSPHLRRAMADVVNPFELQKYILVCCQGAKGGLRDKPGKSIDLYHTCYSLSGLSISQHIRSYHAPASLPPSTEDDTEEESWFTEPLMIFGDPKNILRPVDPVHNLCTGRVDGMQEWFANA